MKRPSKLYRSLIQVILPLSLVLSCLGIHARLASAGPVDELYNHLPPNLAGARNDGEQRKNLAQARWFTPGSTLHRLFLEEHTATQLLDWLKLKPEGWLMGPDQDQSQIIYLHARRYYADSEMRKVFVDVLLPHPKYVDQADLGLIEAFGKFRHPDPEPKFSTEVQVGEATGTLNEFEDGSCALLINTAKNSLVVLSVADWHQKDQLLKLARQADISGLNKRLKE